MFNRDPYLFTIENYSHFIENQLNAILNSKLYNINL